jgi:ECF sigma factor
MFQVPMARRCHGWAGKAKPVMSDEQQASRIQDLIQAVQRGDQEARRELIECAYERLRHLSAVIVRKTFPRLEDSPSLVETTEVADEAAYRLYQTLAEIQAGHRPRLLSPGGGQQGPGT